MTRAWAASLRGSLIPRSKIQRRLLVCVLPLVIVPLVILGVVLWILIGKMIRDESSLFLTEREQDLITLSENSALSDFNLYTDFELKEEAALYQAEFEAYLRRFMARRIYAYAPIYEEIVLIDPDGMERIKVTNRPGSPTYHDVRRAPYFQEAQRTGGPYHSSIQEHMIYSWPVYREAPAGRPYALEKSRRVIVARFNYPLGRFRFRQMTSTFLPPIAGLISISLAVLVITSVVRRIVDPLRQLVDATDRIARGDFQVQIEVHTGDEVEQLAHAFIDMATSLDRLIQQTIESERKYRDLFNRSKDGIFICDLRGRLIDLNKTGIEMLGYAGPDALAHRDSARDLYFTSDDWSLFEARMRERGFVKDFEVHLKRPDGVELDVLITGITRSDLQGTLIGYEGIIRDITEKKRLEQELIQSHKMAAISKLVAGVSHELNTPLAAMLSNLRVCARYHEQLSRLIQSLAEPAAAGNGKGTEALVKIPHLLTSVLGILEETKDAGQKAGSIIASLKKIYHSGAGGSTVSLINLNDELQSVLNLYRQTKEKITFRCLFMPIPLIPCHNNELAQVFINIINNGIHAMDEAGEITIRTGLEGDYVRVAITDAGKGIPPEVLPKIFDPFYTTKGVGEGMGIGLSIVWSIIEKHKGRIQVNSELGRGTTFTIDLPKATQEVTSDQ